MKNKSTPQKNLDGSEAGKSRPISVTEKIGDFRGRIPLPPKCDTTTSDEVLIRTAQKAKGKFRTRENFLEKLIAIDSEIWNVDSDIITNEETEEFEVTVPTNMAQHVYNTIQKLRIPCDVIQESVLNIDIDAFPGTRRICLRVARFGEKFKRFDAKLQRLVDPPELGKPIKVHPGEESKNIRLELSCSTRYAVKYCLTNGEKYTEDVLDDKGNVLHRAGDVIWSDYCKKVQVRTPCEDQPPPPALEPKAGGKIGIHLPKLPPNAQHLTLWLKRDKEGDPSEDFKVFDYLTKKIVGKDGRAIPIWDFGRYVELKLEPDVEYTVKYSLMQNDNWHKSSFETSAKTMPLQPCTL